MQTIAARVDALEATSEDFSEGLAHVHARLDVANENAERAAKSVDHLLGKFAAFDGRLESATTILRDVMKAVETLPDMRRQLQIIMDALLREHETIRKSNADLADVATQAAVLARDVEHIKARVSDARALSESNNRWHREQMLSIAEDQKVPRQLAIDITKGLVVAFFAALMTYLFNR